MVYNHSSKYGKSEQPREISEPKECEDVSEGQYRPIFDAFQDSLINYAGIWGKVGGEVGGFYLKIPGVVLGTFIGGLLGAIVGTVIWMFHTVWQHRGAFLYASWAIMLIASLSFPIVGGNAIGLRESGFIDFKGYNLIEVSLLGWMPLASSLSLPLIVCYTKLSTRKKSIISIVLAALSCVGWVIGTERAKIWLLNMESIEPIVLKYGIGLPFGMTINMITLVVAVIILTKNIQQAYNI